MDVAWWLNLGTFSGILILAIPVWSLNRRKRRLQEIRDADSAAVSDRDFRSQVRKLLLHRHKENVDTWRLRDEICLVVGYLLLLGSSGIRLLVELI